MQTRVSTRGQVVLPGPVRRQLGLRSGDSLDVAVEGKRIVLTAQRSERHVAKIIEDPITGFPVLHIEGDNVPTLTSREVADILADFP